MNCNVNLSHEDKSEIFRFQLFLWLLFGTFLLERIGRFFIVTTYGFTTNYNLITLASTLTFILILTRKFSLGLVAIGLILQLISYYYALSLQLTGFPSSILPIYSHWLISVSIILILLVEIIINLFKPNNGTPVLLRISKHSIGSLRLLVLISLFCAGFAKLNSAFFSPYLGCSSSLLHELRKHNPMIPSFGFIDIIVPYFVVFAELICPIFLFFRRTKYFGLLVLGALFCLLGIATPPNSLYDFAGLFLALLILFLPSVDLYDLCNKSIATVTRYTNQIDSYIKSFISYLLIFITAWCAFITDHLNNRTVGYVIAIVIWILVCVSLFYVLVAVWYRDNHKKQIFINPFSNQRAISILIVLLLILNDGVVYLDISKIPGFNMASGLAVSPIYSNHFVISKVAENKINQVVTVLNTNDPYLRMNMNYSWSVLYYYLLSNYKYTTSVSVDGKIITTPLSALTFVDKVVDSLGWPIYVPFPIISEGPVGCSLHYKR